MRPEATFMPLHAVHETKREKNHHLRWRNEILPRFLQSCYSHLLPASRVALLHNITLCTNPPSLPANSPAFLCFCIIFCLWVEWAKRRRECFFFSPFLTLPSSYCVWANEMYSCLLNHIYIYTHPKTSYRLYSALRSEVVALKAVSVPWSSSKETLANIPNIFGHTLGCCCQFLTRIRGPPSWVRTRTHGLPRSCGGIAIASSPHRVWKSVEAQVDVVVSIEYAYKLESDRVSRTIIII